MKYLVIGCLIGGSAAAQLRLASPFSDHAVLQCGMPVPIWGTAVAGADVSVTFAANRATASADADGRWMLKLPKLEPNAEGQTLTVQSGDSTLVVKDVVIGEVWICSGQSNMQMGRGSVPELNELSETNLRTLEVKRTVAFREKDSLDGKWAVGGPGSAVAFGFAHFLGKQLKGVPVGIILAAWGSTSIEAWMPQDMSAELPYFKTIVDEWEADSEAQAKIKKALAAGKWSGSDDVFMRRQSSGIVYNAMIHPLIPYACQGLVWYQGERNTRYMSGMPKEPWFHRVAGIQEYDETLKAWIQRYRKGWQREDFQFLLVMLPGFGSVLGTSPTKNGHHPTAHSWAWMRESQLAALSLPHTAVANTIDLGHATNIHPRDKMPIGQRLALLAAKADPSRGPVFDRIEKRGAELVVYFSHAKGLKTTDGKAPSEFWIADSAGSWYPAQARIVGETVLLKADGVSQPAHVRYAFTGKPAVNLVNAAELPAYPFRSDSFAP